MIDPERSSAPTSPDARGALPSALASDRDADLDADLDADVDADLDAPAAPLPREAPLRRSASLMAVGLTLLACQQVLGPVISFQLFVAADGTSRGLSTAFTAAHFTVFGVGLVLLVVGLHRFASHVHALAVSAQQR